MELAYYSGMYARAGGCVFGVCLIVCASGRDADKWDAVSVLVGAKDARVRSVRSARVDEATRKF